ncbi:hypothetical protein KOW79_020849 [Hemibagrus wyckioides]|uniref:Uncharacterized protein n=1 Tax=Hemibagrus wyckioides TaxID=337641 RepID=A0A9D3N415_9TELE|nr:hypothetical protein KOW79_020849 [Hemibagrus wyckioides]
MKMFLIPFSDRKLSYSIHDWLHPNPSAKASSSSFRIISTTADTTTPDRTGPDRTEQREPKLLEILLSRVTLPRIFSSCYRKTPANFPKNQ